MKKRLNIRGKGRNSIEFLGILTCLIIVLIPSLSSLFSVQKVSLHPDNLNENDFHPQIALDLFSNSYVTWYGFDGLSDNKVYWTKIDSSGSLKDIQRIYHSIYHDNELPQIAVDHSGNSYLTWLELPAGNDSEIYWVKIDTSGVLGSIVHISTHQDNVNGGDFNPKIAIDASENSYVTWECRDSYWDIYWVKVDSEGTPGIVQKISTHPDNIDGSNDLPEIAVDPSGNSYIAWQGHDGNDSEIYWVKVDSEGTPGIVQKISTHPDNIDGSNDLPEIAVDPSGNSYIAWQGHDGNDSEIYWVKVDSEGTPGIVQKISTHPDNTNFDDYGPQIAINILENSFVTWMCRDGSSWGDTEIYWVRIDSSGVPENVQKVSDNMRNDRYPQIAVDSSDNSYLTWASYDGLDCEIYWAKLDNSGALNTLEKISTHLNQWFYPSPQIAVDSSGNSFLIWEGWDGDDIEIYFASNSSDSIGPLTNNVSASPFLIFSANSTRIQATLDDSTTGNSNIQAAEFFIDSVGADGTGAPMAAQDGSFDSPTENVTAIADVSDLSWGIHRIFVHGQDVSGNWGTTDSCYLIKISLTIVEPKPPSIDQIKPLAQHNIQKAKELLEKAELEFSSFQDSKNQSLREKLEKSIKEATAHIDDAEMHYSNGNYIAANNHALIAIEILEEILRLFNAIYFCAFKGSI